MGLVGRGGEEKEKEKQVADLDWNYELSGSLVI